jgi:hypothetical protein
MTDELELRIIAYLEGELGPEETRALERELAQPEVALLFSRELLVQDCLRQLGPASPPEGLCERIEAALEIDEPRAKQRERMNALRALLRGSGWMVRVPALALAGAGRSFEPTAMGVSTLRYALGSLATRHKPREPKPSLWRRLLPGGKG